MAKMPTEALTTNAIAEAHIVARNKSRKKMKNLAALTCKPKNTSTQQPTFVAVKIFRMNENIKHGKAETTSDRYNIVI